MVISTVTGERGAPVIGTDMDGIPLMSETGGTITADRDMTAIVIIPAGVGVTWDLIGGTIGVAQDTIEDLPGVT